MITNAQPWDNLNFDLEGIGEIQRKYFGTLYNTYSFFSLYANVDGFDYSQKDIDFDKRPEIDRWILSKLNSLVKNVDAAYADYEPTRAGRLIQDFVTDQLSNWYVRLCRRRFWKGDFTEDKISAYQTLYTCLTAIAKMTAPIAPFFADRLYRDLNAATGKEKAESVHLALFPEVDKNLIDTDLEERMEIAQQVVSMALSLRKKEHIRVRQPLQKIMVPILNEKFERQLQSVEDLILSEINVKELEYLKDSGVLVKQIKPNFKALGPKYGKQMKSIAAAVGKFDQDDIQKIETDGEYRLDLEGEEIVLTQSDVEITSQDIPGWLVTTEGQITVALDITLTDELREEGIAREFVNRIQNLRKDSGLEVTEKIALQIKKHDFINAAIEKNLNYICSETLAGDLQLVDSLDSGEEVEVSDEVTTRIAIRRLN